MVFDFWLSFAPAGFLVEAWGGRNISLPSLRHSSIVLSVVCLSLVLGSLRADAQAAVWTYHNDNYRTGRNTSEVILNLTNVNPASFARLFTNTVDGMVYAQPLYVPDVAIPGQGTRNLLLIATEHNTVYAFDADLPVTAGGLLWKTNLGTSAVTPNSDFGNRHGPYGDLVPEVGITGTPVIDLAAGTLYVDAFTHDGTSYFHRLHALNITNGTERTGGPVMITASVAGNGVVVSMLELSEVDGFDGVVEQFRSLRLAR